MSKNEGWVCPLCGVVNAPWVEQCHCRNAAQPAWLPVPPVWPWPSPPYEITCGVTPSATSGVVLMCLDDLKN